MRDPDQRGFTLVEVSLALLIMSLLIVSFMQLIITSIRSNNISELQDRASYSTQSILESVISSRDELDFELLTDKGLVDVEIKDPRLNEVLIEAGYRINTFTDEQGTEKEDLFRIDAEIKWKSPDKIRTYTLYTLIYSHPFFKNN